MHTCICTHKQRKTDRFFNLKLMPDKESHITKTFRKLLEEVGHFVTSSQYNHEYSF